MHFSRDNLGRKDIIGSFSSNVFEPRTSTESEPFSILHCLDATKFVLLRVFILMKMICAKICFKSRLKNAQVYVRLICVTQKRRSLNSLITGLTDGWTHLRPSVWLFDIKRGLRRIPKSLTFIMRLGAQPFLWKWVLFAHQRRSTYPRFQRKARGNLEMAYWAF